MTPSIHPLSLSWWAGPTTIPSLSHGGRVPQQTTLLYMYSIVLSHEPTEHAQSELCVNVITCSFTSLIADLMCVCVCDMHLLIHTHLALAPARLFVLSPIRGRVCQRYDCEIIPANLFTQVAILLRLVTMTLKTLYQT